MLSLFCVDDNVCVQGFVNPFVLLHETPPLLVSGEDLGFSNYGTLVMKPEQTERSVQTVGFLKLTVSRATTHFFSIIGLAVRSEEAAPSDR